MNELFFKYKEKTYPDLIQRGNHTQYILATAKRFCQGRGIDIGCSKSEWAFPNTDMCDETFEAPWNDALFIPRGDGYYDFVFSSHCLEHIGDYFQALKEWTRILKHGGVLFLYLPSVECEYWRPCNDRKHKHIFYKEDIEMDLKELNYSLVLSSGVDLAFSWSLVAIKK